MEDQEIEYKGISIIVNSQALQDGTWSAIFTRHEYQITTPFNIDPIYGATEADATTKALSEARNEIDDLLLTREIVRSETEPQKGISYKRGPA